MPEMANTDVADSPRSRPALKAKSQMLSPRIKEYPFMAI
jgi:hypothetical protein